MTGKTAGN